MPHPRRGREGASVYEVEIGRVQPWPPRATRPLPFRRRSRSAAQAESESDSFAELERWIAENLKADLRIDALAERMHMSPRNFARVYVEKRGRTPAKAVEAIRLDAARRRLEETADRIEAIAEHCGYTGEEQMRAASVRVLNTPPREYHKHFATGKRLTEARAAR